MTDQAEAQLAKLRAQVERALERTDASSASLATSLLTRMLTLVPETSDDALFAHRHLAELLLEKAPWRAALHVKKALEFEDADDALHAMMGLCQALLGNYRAAVSAYGRAARLAPNVGWYHHNLGHLLDVALDEPARAEQHLRTACRLASHHDEVVASLAHCLARLDRKDEALELARRARALKPNKPAHRELYDWISDSPESAKLVSRDKPKSERVSERAREVADSFDAQMRVTGYSEPMLAMAHEIWSDFSRGRTLRTVKSAVYAAAIEYAVATLTQWPGASQASVGRRYGVSPSSVATRYGEIRDALELDPFDPRYVSKT